MIWCSGFHGRGKRVLPWREERRPVRRPVLEAGLAPLRLRRGLRIAAALLVPPMLSGAPSGHADPEGPTFEEHCPKPDPNCWSDQSGYHAFFTPPNPLPGKPGELVRFEPQNGIRLEPSGQLEPEVSRLRVGPDVVTGQR